MTTFIFQSVQERYDLRVKLEAGKRDTWYATRYRNQMNVGDIAYFWMGGTAGLRGLYGWGEITSQPYLRPEWESHGVDVLYKVRFSNFISYTHFLSDNILSKILILRAPSASNFILSEQETLELSRLVTRHGEQSPMGTA